MQYCSIAVCTCQPEEVLDSEPRDADRLDQREDWVLDRGLAFKVLIFKICLQGQSLCLGLFGCLTIKVNNLELWHCVHAPIEHQSLN